MQKTQAMSEQSNGSEDEDFSDDYGEDDFNESDNNESDTETVKDETDKNAKERISVNIPTQNHVNDFESTDDGYDERDDKEIVSDITTRPEVKLAQLRQKNVSHMTFDDSKRNRIQCLALCKIVYGFTHWRVAEAHIDLAAVYLRGKVYGLQTLKHVNLARDILLDYQSGSYQGDSMQEVELPHLLQKLYLLMGRAYLQLKNPVKAGHSLRKAQLISDNVGVSLAKNAFLRADILSSLATSISKKGKIGEATEYIEEALDLVEKISVDNSFTLVKLYKQLASTELLNGKHANIENVLQNYSKALKITTEIYGENSMHVADLLIVMARQRASSKREMSNPEEAETDIKRAVEIIRSQDGAEEKLITTEQLLCKLLIQQGKHAEAKTLLDGCKKNCEEIFDDTSIISAEVYELYGSLLFSQQKMSAALKYFLKAEDIYKGKQKCKAKREKLAKLIDVIRRSSKDDKLKTGHEKLKDRPRFNAEVTTPKSFVYKGS